MASSELEQLVHFLRDSIDDQTPPDRRQAAYMGMEQLRQRNDFGNMLIFIFSDGQQHPNIRQCAGLHLKNILLRSLHLPSEALHSVLQQILVAIGDNNESIRGTVSSLIDEIVGLAKGFDAFPELLPQLTQLLGNDDLNRCGALCTLDFLMESKLPLLLNSPLSFERVESLIPVVINLFNSANERNRIHALNAINQVILQPMSLHPLMEKFLPLYLEGVFFLAKNDNSVEVRQLICIAFIALINKAPSAMLPHLEGVVNYMLSLTNVYVDDRLALEACEFWTAMPKAYPDHCRSILFPFLPELVPTLVSAMIYSDVEVHNLIPEENDGKIPDMKKDIRPRYRSLRSTGSSHQKEEEHDPSVWTLRKSAANSLDILSNVFHSDLLLHLIPLLEPKMSTNNWKELESAILAVGAVAYGCTESISVHLPHLVPFLVLCMNHDRALVRTIACWSISRYSNWICDFSAYPEAAQDIFNSSLSGLLRCILDNSKKVQESACSSLASFLEEAREMSYPYMGSIVNHLMEAFSNYQAKNRLNLLDTLNSFISLMDHDIFPFAHLIVPPLIEKMKSLEETDRELCTVMECISASATSLHSDFQPYARTVYEHCVRLMTSSLELLQEDPEEHDAKEVLITSIDLVAALALAFEKNIIFLLREYPQFIDLIFACLQVNDRNVQQNTVALIGDIAKNAIDFLRPRLPDVLAILIGFLSPEYPALCNNASWAIGDIALQIGQDIRPFVEPTMNQFSRVFAINGPQYMLPSTVCLTIGRLCRVCPEECARFLPRFISFWCLHIPPVYRERRESQTSIREKESAIMAVCEVINLNPEGVLDSFVLLCGCFASHSESSPDLFPLFQQLLQSFKSRLPQDTWNQILQQQQCPPQLLAFMQEKFGV